MGQFTTQAKASQSSMWQLINQRIVGVERWENFWAGTKIGRI